MSTPSNRSGGPAATSRRDFLRSALTGGGALVLGVSFGDRVRAAVLGPNRPLPADFMLGAFLRIRDDGKIQFVAKHDEMGQGIHTGLAIAVVRGARGRRRPGRRWNFGARQAAAFAHSTRSAIQVTGGSTSTWSSFEQMRQGRRGGTRDAGARRCRRAGASTPSALARRANGAVHREGRSGQR